MRRRAHSYRTIDGITSERDAVAWYWRMIATITSVTILGGYLILPASFDNDPQLRVSKTGLGIFAVALLVAGFCVTGLLCFAVRNPLFRADSIYLPSLTSCALGLLTVLYDFLISSRYVWNTPSLLVTIAASLSTIVYAALLIFTYHRISIVRSQGPAVPLAPRSISINSGTDLRRGSGLRQGSGYFENYIRNMFPTSSREPQPLSYDPNSLTEEEMQRQQMLMLLLQKDQPSTPDPSQSTFHIDWQGQEQDDVPPHGYYAPQSASSSSPYPQTAYTPHSALSRHLTGELRPWDGVWRGPARGRTSYSSSQWDRATSRGSREERRREIELGR